MSNLFKKQKTPAPEQITAPEEEKAKGILSRYMQFGEQTRAPEAYPGRLTAQPQAYESYISPLMESYATRATSPLYTSAQDLMQKTLTGGFDPSTSDYYKSLRRQVLEEGEESKQRMRQAAQIGGMLRSSGRLGQEADIESDIRTGLSDIMASLTQQERQNQLSTLYPALSYTQFGEQQPLNTLQALMTAGGYQTGQQQSALDRLYQEYQRQIGEEKYPLQTAQLLANPQMYQWMQPSYQPSFFQENMMPLIQMAIRTSAMRGGTA